MLRQLAATACLLGMLACWVAMIETLQSLNKNYKKPYFISYWVQSFYALMYVAWKIWRIFPGGFSCNKVAEGAFTGQEKRFIIFSAVMAVIQQFGGFAWYLSLTRTNIPANMAIYQCAPALVFVLSVPLLKERTTFLKVVSVLLSVGGAALVSFYSYHDQCSGGGSNSNSSALAFTEHWRAAAPNTSCDPAVEQSTPLGYVYLVVSLLLYALLSTLTKKFLTRKGDPAAVPNVLRYVGYTGVFTVLFLWPLIIVFHYTGVEEFVLPSLNMLGFMFVNVALELCFKCFFFVCIALSSPLYATVGTVLTIPASVITDWMIQRFTLPPLAYVGIVCILVGFAGFTFAAFVAARREGKEEQKAKQSSIQNQNEKLTDLSDTESRYDNVLSQNVKSKVWLYLI